ncbi:MULTISPECIES: hypothetical protein [Stenotrophomonas]|uniref:hypothetical protein n=1 Tax=Stenotrophomonas TaxID=40323 RepID=UPI001445CA03|nr:MULTISPECIES: hypothetical protein [Stenotrophomonas]MBH1512936.1 hypothetical protein [Stenotrophomonas maltophilia]MBH1547682.1 hypothetical protein [Stenotrophomonas maltophilia]MBH1862884.1 hypothetical protein [Stenotrophomonas maltophilia]MBN5064410.1 hypothetical protein [Stenotrophomonas maltophilia]MCU1033653.1 hypothetical protein [Stenotrophomonas maltophilia]
MVVQLTHGLGHVAASGLVLVVGDSPMLQAMEREPLLLLDHVLRNRAADQALPGAVEG